MKKIVLLLLIVPFTLLLGQEKYFIYFKDKGPVQSLQKNSPSYQNAIHTLSKHAIERRMKVMNADSLIKFEDVPLFKEYIKSLTTNGIKIENKLKWFNSVSAYLDTEQKKFVKTLSFVKKIEPVKTLNFQNDRVKNFSLSKITNSDPSDYGNSYNQLALSDIPLVHSKGITGNGILIGVLDTGFDWKFHEALKNIHVVSEYDFVFHDSVTADQAGDVPGQDSHGTFVFSVIGGCKDSVLIGSSYGASFILAKTEDIRSETHIEEDNYAAALEWMENLGVDITSSSLGYNIFDTGTSYTYEDMDGKSTIITKAAELAFQRGVVTITSAGNEGNNSWYYIIAPADGFNTIAVGAVYQDSLVASFSSRGPTYDGRIKPDVVALGVDVYGASTNGSNNYTYGTGTSSAAPIAGGVAALLLSAYPQLTNEQVRNILLETSGNSQHPDNDRGYGLLSASRAISYPNLLFSDGRYILNKAFVQELSVSNVQLHYSTDNTNFDTLSMNSVSEYKFQKELPLIPINDIVNFYFTYMDESGTPHRDPEIYNYKFRSGTLNISLNLPLAANSIDYVLSNNYPNPFNSITKINFVAENTSPAEIIIFDAIGRKVKSLFRGISTIGVNTVIWDGTTDAGTFAASGIYIYVLKLEGKLYPHKMVYLK